MRALRSTLFAAAAAAGMLGMSAAQAGPAPQEAKESRIEELRLGEYWFGPDIQHADLVGKVVLVEIWGS